MLAQAATAFNDFIWISAVANCISQVHDQVATRRGGQAGFQCLEVVVNVAQQEYEHRSPEQTRDYRPQHASEYTHSGMIRNQNGISAVHHRTTRPMSGSDFHQRWQGSRTFLDTVLTSRVERTPCRHCVRRRDAALNRLQRLMT